MTELHHNRDTSRDMRENWTSMLCVKGQFVARAQLTSARQLLTGQRHLMLNICHKIPVQDVYERFVKPVTCLDLDEEREARSGWYINTAMLTPFPTGSANLTRLHNFLQAYHCAGVIRVGQDLVLLVDAMSITGNWLSARSTHMVSRDQAALLVVWMSRCSKTLANGVQQASRMAGNQTRNGQFDEHNSTIYLDNRLVDQSGLSDTERSAFLDTGFLLKPPASSFIHPEKLAFHFKHCGRGQLKLSSDNSAEIPSHCVKSNNKKDGDDDHKARKRHTSDLSWCQSNDEDTSVARKRHKSHASSTHSHTNKGLSELRAGGVGAPPPSGEKRRHKSSHKEKERKRHHSKSASSQKQSSSEKKHSSSEKKHSSKHRSRSGHRSTVDASKSSTEHRSSSSKENGRKSTDAKAEAKKEKSAVEVKPSPDSKSKSRNPKLSSLLETRRQNVEKVFSDMKIRKQDITQLGRIPKKSAALIKDNPIVDGKTQPSLSTTRLQIDSGQCDDLDATFFEHGIGADREISMIDNITVSASVQAFINSTLGGNKKAEKSSAKLLHKEDRIQSKLTRKAESDNHSNKGDDKNNPDPVFSSVFSTKYSGSGIPGLDSYSVESSHVASLESNCRQKGETPATGATSDVRRSELTSRRVVIKQSQKSDSETASSKSGFEITIKGFNGNKGLCLQSGIMDVFRVQLHGMTNSTPTSETTDKFQLHAAVNSIHSVGNTNKRSFDVGTRAVKVLIDMTAPYQPKTIKAELGTQLTTKDRQNELELAGTPIEHLSMTHDIAIKKGLEQSEPKKLQQDVIKSAVEAELHNKTSAKEVNKVKDRTEERDEATTDRSDQMNEHIASDDGNTVFFETIDNVPADEEAKEAEKHVSVVKLEASKEMAQSVVGRQNLEKLEGPKTTSTVDAVASPDAVCKVIAAAKALDKQTGPDAENRKTDIAENRDRERTRPVQKEEAKRKLDEPALTSDRKLLNRLQPIKERSRRASGSTKDRDRGGDDGNKTDKVSRTETEAVRQEKRQSRQYHPYRKDRQEDKEPRKPWKPKWSFDIAYRDMGELLQNLTENSFRKRGYQPADVKVSRPRSQRRKASGRFRDYRFERSAVPRTPPRNDENRSDEEEAPVVPSVIPNLEERGRQADMVEEIYFGSEEQEEFSAEMNAYSNDKTVGVQKGVSNKPNVSKTALIIPGGPKTFKYSGVNLDGENDKSVELESTGRSMSSGICRSISTESKGNEVNIDLSAEPVEVTMSVELKEARKEVLQKQDHPVDKRIVVASELGKVAKETTTEQKITDVATTVDITTKCTGENIFNRILCEEATENANEERETDVEYMSDPNEERSYIVVDDVEDSEDALIEDVSSGNGMNKQVTSIFEKKVRSKTEANLLDGREGATIQQTCDTISEYRSTDSNMVSDQQKQARGFSPIIELADSTEEMCLADSNQKSKVRDQDHVKDVFTHDHTEKMSDAESSHRKAPTGSEVKTEIRSEVKVAKNANLRENTTESDINAKEITSLVTKDTSCGYLSSENEMCAMRYHVMDCKGDFNGDSSKETVIDLAGENICECICKVGEVCLVHYSVVDAVQDSDTTVSSDMEECAKNKCNLKGISKIASGQVVKGTMNQTIDSRRCECICKPGQVCQVHEKMVSLETDHELNLSDSVQDSNLTVISDSEALSIDKTHKHGTTEKTSAQTVNEVMNKSTFNTKNCECICNVNQLCPIHETCDQSFSIESGDELGCFPITLPHSDASLIVVEGIDETRTMGCESDDENLLLVEEVLDETKDIKKRCECILKVNQLCPMHEQSNQSLSSASGDDMDSLCLPVEGSDVKLTKDKEKNVNGNGDMQKVRDKNLAKLEKCTFNVTKGKICECDGNCSVHDETEQKISAEIEEESHSEFFLGKKTEMQSSSNMMPENKLHCFENKSSNTKYLPLNDITACDANNESTANNTVPPFAQKISELSADNSEESLKPKGSPVTLDEDTGKTQAAYTVVSKHPERINVSCSNEDMNVLNENHADNGKITSIERPKAEMNSNRITEHTKEEMIETLGGLLRDNSEGSESVSEETSEIIDEKVTEITDTLDVDDDFITDNNQIGSTSETQSNISQSEDLNQEHYSLCKTHNEKNSMPLLHDNRNNGLNQTKTFEDDSMDISYEDIDSDSTLIYGSEDNQATIDNRTLATHLHSSNYSPSLSHFIQTTVSPDPFVPVESIMPNFSPLYNLPRQPQFVNTFSPMWMQEVPVWSHFQSPLLPLQQSTCLSPIMFPMFPLHHQFLPRQSLPMSVFLDQVMHGNSAMPPQVAYLSNNSPSGFSDGSTIPYGISPRRNLTISPPGLPVSPASLSSSLQNTGECSQTSERKRISQTFECSKSSDHLTLKGVHAQIDDTSQAEVSDANVALGESGVPRVDGYANDESTDFHKRKESEINLSTGEKVDPSARNDIDASLNHDVGIERKHTKVDNSLNFRSDIALIKKCEIETPSLQKKMPSDFEKNRETSENDESVSSIALSKSLICCPKPLTELCSTIITKCNFPQAADQENVKIDERKIEFETLDDRVSKSVTTSEDNLSRNENLKNVSSMTIEHPTLPQCQVHIVEYLCPVSLIDLCTEKMSQQTTQTSSCKNYQGDNFNDNTETAEACIGAGSSDLVSGSCIDNSDVHAAEDVKEITKGRLINIDKRISEFDTDISRDPVKCESECLPSLSVGYTLQMLRESTSQTLDNSGKTQHESTPGILNLAHNDSCTNEQEDSILDKKSSGQVLNSEVNQKMHMTLKENGSLEVGMLDAHSSAWLGADTENESCVKTDISSANEGLQEKNEGNVGKVTGERKQYEGGTFFSDSSFADNETDKDELHDAESVLKSKARHKAKHQFHGSMLKSKNQLSVGNTLMLLRASSKADDEEQDIKPQHAKRFANKGKVDGKEILNFYKCLSSSDAEQTRPAEHHVRKRKLRKIKSEKMKTTIFSRTDCKLEVIKEVNNPETLKNMCKNVIDKGNTTFNNELSHLMDKTGKKQTTSVVLSLKEICLQSMTSKQSSDLRGNTLTDNTMSSCFIPNSETDKDKKVSQSGEIKEDCSPSEAVTNTLCGFQTLCKEVKDVSLSSENEIKSSLDLLMSAYDGSDESLTESIDIQCETQKEQVGTIMNPAQEIQDEKDANVSPCLDEQHNQENPAHTDAVTESILLLNEGEIFKDQCDAPDHTVEGHGLNIVSLDYSQNNEILSSPSPVIDERKLGIEKQNILNENSTTDRRIVSFSRQDSLASSEKIKSHARLGALLDGYKSHVSRVSGLKRSKGSQKVANSPVISNELIARGIRRNKYNYVVDWISETPEPKRTHNPTHISRPHQRSVVSKARTCLKSLENEHQKCEDQSERRVDSPESRRVCQERLGCSSPSSFSTSSTSSDFSTSSNSSEGQYISDQREADTNQPRGRNKSQERDRSGKEGSIRHNRRKSNSSEKKSAQTMSQKSRYKYTSPKQDCQKLSSHQQKPFKEQRSYNRNSSRKGEDFVYTYKRNKQNSGSSESKTLSDQSDRSPHRSRLSKWNDSREWESSSRQHPGSRSSSCSSVDSSYRSTSSFQNQSKSPSLRQKVLTPRQHRFPSSSSASSVERSQRDLGNKRKVEGPVSDNKTFDKQVSKHGRGGHESSSVKHLSPYERKRSGTGHRHGAMSEGGCSVTAFNRSIELSAREFDRQCQSSPLRPNTNLSPSVSNDDLYDASSALADYEDKRSKKFSKIKKKVLLAMETLNDLRPETLDELLYSLHQHTTSRCCWQFSLPDMQENKLLSYQHTRPDYHRLLDILSNGCYRDLVDHMTHDPQVTSVERHARMLLQDINVKQVFVISDTLTRSLFWPSVTYCSLDTFLSEHLTSM